MRRIADFGRHTYPPAPDSQPRAPVSKSLFENLCVGYMYSLVDLAIAKHDVNMRMHASKQICASCYCLWGGYTV